MNGNNEIIGFLPALECLFVEAEFHAGSAGGRRFLLADKGRHFERRDHLVSPRTIDAQFAGIGQTDLLGVNCVNRKLRFGQRLCKIKKRQKMTETHQSISNKKNGIQLKVNKIPSPRDNVI